MRVLSWGCGVQSTTLGEMSARGELEALDAIVTADAGWERARTYEIRDFYAERWRTMGLRVEIVQAGNIRKMGAEEHVHVPFWTSDGGPLRRQCTRYFKVRPVRRKVREIVGFHPSKPPHPPPGAVEVWLGISLDEWTRAKVSPVRYIVHRWPLLERHTDRQGCVEYLEGLGLPVPPTSACVICPYRSASEWIVMRDEAPDEFDDAIRFDEANRHNPLAEREGSTCDELFIYKWGGPLAEANLEADAAREKCLHGTQLPMTFDVL